MSHDMSILGLITGASLLVQLVMLLLLLASVASWTIILKKRRQLAVAQKAAQKFEQQFWKADDLTQLYHQVRESGQQQGLSAIFLAGFKEYLRVVQDGDKPRHGFAPDEAITRAMKVHTTREIDNLEAELTMLATIGSTSPYVGLFGTVWGIMNSFRALGGVQQATLSMVAPGIAEALVATAMGLFAAIPAVIAYNGLSNRVERLDTRYETFAEELTQILLRHLQSPPEKA
jgi:biopolymer transport protein TolQ